MHSNMLSEVKGRIVVVLKKSRGRFPLKTATPGTTGFVVNVWQNQVGTQKMTILEEDGSTSCTSISCISPDIEDPSNQWQKIKDKHDLDNSIPIIVKCLAVGKKAYRLKSLNNKIFFHSHKGKPEHGKGDCFTIDMQIWLAKKQGILLQ